MMSDTELTATDPLTGLRYLQAHLEARLNAGDNRLWMSPEATNALREIVRMKPGRMTWAAPARVAEPVAVPVAVPAPPVAAPAPAPVKATPAPAPVIVQEASPLPAAPREVPAAEVDKPLTLPERQARLAEVRQRAAAGERARALGTLRDTMVFAVGNPEARIMLVGEAPGADEERQGEPFVGRAGQKLDQILKAMGFERPDVYISNVCKYRPAMEDQRTGNRKPTAAEMESCVEFVREEIRIVRPSVLVALGATAAEGLLGISGGAVSRLRARFHECQGIPLIVTYHPSWLLRQEDGPEAMASKRLVWEDMLMVMDRLEMPVTKKQRAYFLAK